MVRRRGNVIPRLQAYVLQRGDKRGRSRLGPDAEQANGCSSYAPLVSSWRTIVVPATIAWSLPTAMFLGLQPKPQSGLTV